MQSESVQKLFPALHETPKSQMTSKEFQRMLYTWFDEKGLVQDLRSYLRLLMINELRNTAMGKIESKTSNFSLSKQAFSLVIAEHLLREGCHYTLSIFSTEVPGVATQLPFSLFDAHFQAEKWRFDQESLTNVLELIGVSKNSAESLRVSALYFRGDDSLLSCLVSSKSVEFNELENFEGDYLMKVLSVLGVPQKISENIKKRVEEEFLDYGRQIELLTAQLRERNEQMKRLIEEQLIQRKENKKLKHELKETKRHLGQAVLQEQNLQVKERRIQEKLDEVTRLQRSLEKSLNKEKVQVCGLKHCTEACSELSEELRRLEEANREKTLEVERLNIKIKSLMKDLNNSRLNIEFLNSCLLHSNQINLQSDTGGKKDSSSESSENITGEILKEVRSRLQQLERESDQLDVRFKKLKMNDFVTN